METLALILKWLLPPAYLAALWAYGRAFFREQGNGDPVSVAKAAWAAPLAVHSGLLFALAATFRRCPLWTQGEALLFLGWMLLLLHVLSEWSADTRRLGVFTILPAALCATFSLFFLGRELELSPDYRSSWFIFHIVASLASYAAFGLAAVLASLYLTQHRKLKAKHFDRTFRRLPPLDRLDKLTAVWAFLGTLLMIASSAIGAWWVRRDSLHGMTVQEAGIFVALVIFLGVAASRRVLGWRGRRHAIGVLWGVAALAFANLWLHGFFRA
ncbi:MAG TPA: cytochrome c biogenesis protein CcsA [Fibrobacteria bacterium]|nr:cytochrome c biogenesis protein CcsA [Fibrobacteria bacterium]